jgi:hypothetical protein
VDVDSGCVGGGGGAASNDDYCGTSSSAAGVVAPEGTLPLYGAIQPEAPSCESSRLLLFARCLLQSFGAVDVRLPPPRALWAS